MKARKQKPTPTYINKKARPLWGRAQKKSGNVLLSHRVTPAVPSAQEGLTTLFGMERGVTPPLWSPEKTSFPRQPNTVHTNVVQYLAN